MKGFDASRLRGRGRVIAVNDAGLYLAPWSDVLFWADRRWLDWNVDKLPMHTGPLKVSRKAPHLETGFDVKVMGFLPGRLSNDPEYVGGHCGGSSALNLAYLFGSRRIVLLGFDMRPGNWHDNHKLPSLGGQHERRFIPALERMAPELRKAGCDVINATPGSALTCFPMLDLQEVLDGFGLSVVP